MVAIVDQMFPSYDRNIKFSEPRNSYEGLTVSTARVRKSTFFVYSLKYGHASRHLSEKHRKIISKTAFPVLRLRLFKLDSAFTCHVKSLQRIESREFRISESTAKEAKGKQLKFL